VLEAYSLYRGISRRILPIRPVRNCGKAKVKVDGIILHPLEEATVEAAVTCGIPLVSSDIRVRRVLGNLKSQGLSVYSLQSLLRSALKENLISRDELSEVIVSLRALPLIVARDLLETG
jgi:protein involved in polysaccharide export with SLBB domain